MKDFLSKIAGAIMLQLITMTFCGVAKAEIVYQHNFDNLSVSATDAELSTPSTISPGFTSSWSFPSNSAVYGINTNGRRVLSVAAAPGYTFRLKVPKCKKLDITGISFWAKALDEFTTYQIKINGMPFGSPFAISQTFTHYTIDKPEIPEILDEITIEISIQFDNDQQYIDDFTLDGIVTDQEFQPESFVFPGAGVEPFRCQRAETISYNMDTKYSYNALWYSLDETSNAAGVQLIAPMPALPTLRTFWAKRPSQPISPGALTSLLLRHIL